MSEYNLYTANRINDLIVNCARTGIGMFNRYTQRAVRDFDITDINNCYSDLISSYEKEHHNIQRKIKSELESIRMPSAIHITNEKKALLVGINYTDTDYRLNGCIQDINNIDNLISKYNFNEITKLIDDGTTIRPTRANIMTELTYLLQNANVGDFLLFAFSGHGSQTNINLSETDFLDEGFLAVDGFIIDNEVNAIISQFLPKDVTLFMLFDCCHSGTIGDLKYNYMDYSENTLSIDTIGNVIILSGCRDDQSSAEATIDTKIQGAMTSTFIKSLKPGITWRNLVTDIRESLAKAGFDQIPKLSSGKFINLDTKFPLA
jgi:hypothetical protein